VTAATNKLPYGWAITTLGAIHLDLAAGVIPAEHPEELFELFSVPSHDQGIPETLHGREIGSNKQTVEPKTVLLSKINPRINRVWVAEPSGKYKAIASTEWIPFFPLNGLEPRYLAYFLRQNSVRDYLARNASGVGGSLMRIKAATLRDFPFPLAPQQEQRRMADTLDELLSALDAGVAALKQVCEKLKQYRIAVLNEAVEGGLTAEWRAQHPANESASALLACILAERRQRWEKDQVRKFKESGKAPPKDWKARYEEPSAANTTGLTGLPPSWCWASAEQLTDFITKGTTPAAPLAPTATGEIPFLKVQHLSDIGAFHFLDSPSFVSRTTHETFLARSKVFPNDVLMNIVGPPLGQVSIIPSDHPEWNMNQAIAVFRPLGGIPSKFVAICLLSRTVLNQALKRSKTTAGQVNLTLEVCRELAIPLPPLREQLAIVEAAEDHLSVIDHLEAGLHAKLKSAQGLGQAILRQAFEGKLVPQDPNDEPASELLKRIAVERTELESVAKAAKKTKVLRARAEA
jgi:type I restriction enzyme, S subunit